MKLHVNISYMINQYANIYPYYKGAIGGPHTVYIGVISKVGYR